MGFVRQGGNGAASPLGERGVMRYRRVNFQSRWVTASDEGGT
jgi:hypothetical protein